MRVKRSFAVFLCAVMVFTCMPIEASASTLGALAKNTKETNQSILSQIEALLDDGEENTSGAQGEASRKKVLDTLQQLGLLDENGELVLDQKVSLNGKEYTLTEIESMIDNGADLTQIAYVDGVPIALGDLRTMINIEKQLKYIKETYFSDVKYSDEQKESLNDLVNYLQTNSVSLLSSSAGSPIDDHNVVDTRDYYVVKLEGDYLSDTSKQETYKYVNQAYPLSAKKDITFSFKYSLLNDADGGKAVVLLLRKNGSKYDIVQSASAKSGTFSYKPNKTETLYLAVGTSESIILKDKNGTPYIFYGDVYGAISFSDAAGITFEGTTVETNFTALFSQCKYDAKIKADGGAYSYGVYSYKGAVREPIKNSSESWLCSYTETSKMYLTALRKKTIDNENDLVNLSTYSKEGEILESWGLMAKQAYKSDTYQQKFRYSYTFATESSYALQCFNEPADGKFKWRYNEKELASGEAYSDSDGNPIYTDDTYFGSFNVVSTSTVPYASLTTSGNLPPNTSTELFWAEPLDNITENEISISVPTTVKNYTPGEYIPILMRVNECVTLNDAKIKINNKEYAIKSQLHAQQQGTLFLLWYQVRENDAAHLTVALTGVKSDNTITGFESMWTEDHDAFKLKVGAKTTWKFDDINIASLKPYRAAASTGLTVSGGEGDTSDKYKITVSAAIPEDTNWQNQWNNNFEASAVVLNNADGSTIETLPLTINDTSTVAEGSVQVEKAIAEQNCTVRLVLKEKGGANAFVRYADEKTLQIPAFEFVNGVSVNDASSVRRVLLSDTYRPELTLSFSGNPTCTSGTWTSSDDEIATIEVKEGKYYIATTGKKLGDVKFTFTANDGGKTDPNQAAIKTAESAVYTVAAGNTPALVIPEHSENILVTSGASARVLWSSNAGFFATNDFEFTVDLYEGCYTEDELAGKTAVYSTCVASEETSAQIPAAYLQNISVGMIPKYTVRISMPYPNKEYSGLEMSTMAYIVVRPKPATISLTSNVEGSYLLDSRDNVKISWNVNEYSAGNTKGSVVITRVSGDADTEEIYRTDSITESGSYTLELKKVSSDNIKDTYMIQAQVSNDTSNDGWSTESFPLYVYRDGFLSLVDEKGSALPDSITLDNTSLVQNYVGSNINGGQTTDEVLRLREKLGLYLSAGVNYDSQTWLQKRDAIRWATSNDEKVHVNYAQGGVYDNITQYNYSEFLPSVSMMLSSDADGAAVVTATHANTGVKDSVNINVKTLKDTFYMFRVFPAKETTLSYTDGKGENKTVTTDENGVLALYEPDGIKSDIYLKSIVSDKVYLGTIYASELETGEGDFAQGRLYPINTIKLREAAAIELKLKKPDASCYEGKLTLRGGVYKNGGYCQDAKLGSSPNSLTDGSIGTVFTANRDGTITVYFDSTQFWSSENGETAAEGGKLSAADEIYYLFELTEFKDGTYYPVFIDASGSLSEDDLMKSAGNIITLEEKMEGDDTYHRVQQIVSYPNTDEAPKDVSHKNGYIGASASLPESVLTTLYYVLDPDADAASYKIEMMDQDGVVPDCQTSEAIKYPFATHVVLRNTLTMTKSTLTDSGWLNKEAGRRFAKLSTRIYKNDSLVKETPTGLKVVDMTNAGDAKDAASVAENLSRYSDISTFLTGKLKTGVADKTDENAVVTTLVGLLKTDTIAGDMPVKMILYPTESNTRFKAMLVVGTDGLDLQSLDYSESGIAWGYNYLDTEEATPMSNKAKRQMAMKAATAVAEDTSGTTSGKAKAAVASAKLNSSGTNMNLTLEGVYEAEITYDFVEEEWKIYTVGGGAKVGFGVERTKNINTTQYGIPFTASFSLSGSGQLSVSTAVRFNEVSEALKWTTGYDNVNDFLVALRLNAYFEAFGGVGYDYSIVGVKVGLFGRISVDAEMDWLLRNYLADASQRKKDGQFVKLSGSAGAKFEVDMALFSFEFILGSGAVSYAWPFGDAEYIQNYWKTTGSGYDDGGGMLFSSSTVQLHSREYLDEYARSYGTAVRLMYANEDLTTLQDNANPASKPQTTSDGKILLYVSDCGETSIYKSRVMAGESMTSAKRIDALDSFDGFGDYSPSLSGNGNFAVAAWSRLASPITGKDSGDEITADERLLLMRSSEIVASVYDGTEWKATRLTDNSTADLAAASAASNGHAIVAWRSVYTDNTKDVTDFQDDRIFYRTYENGVWGEERMLYNGTSGTVKSLNMAMLSDGTAIAAYTLCTDDGNTSLAYSLIDAAGMPNSTMFITNDDGSDENVQLEAVKNSDGKENFLLAWHSTASVENTSGDNGTIRFLLVNKDGVMSNTFPESANELCNDENVKIPGTFWLAQPGTDESLDRVPILWAQSVDANGNPVSGTSGEADHNVIYGVKFCYTGEGKIYLSAPQVIAQLPARTLLNDVSAYVDSNDTICMTMLTTWYDDAQFDYYNAQTGLRYEGGGVPSGDNWVVVPKEKCLIQSASGTLINSIVVDSIDVDYEDLALNSLTPIRFNVRNAGIEPVSKFSVTVDGKESVFPLEKPLMPNETASISYYYTIGEKLKDPTYSIKAFFPSEEKTISNTVYLCYPDIGISQMEVWEENEGTRTVRMTLYNDSPSELKAGTHTVKMGLYSDGGYSTIEAVKCTASGVKVESNHTLTVSDGDALRQINEGAFSIDIVYDVKDYLNRQKLTEIPAEGLYLYADTWIISDDAVQPEVNEENNNKNVNLESLLVRNGEAFTTTLEQDNSGDTTSAVVTLSNNSMSSRQNGALIANLLDNNGNLLEQKQITLDRVMAGESSAKFALNFEKKGSQISLMSGILSEEGDQNEAALTSLTFQGWPINLEGFKPNETSDCYTASVTVDNRKTLIMYQCVNKNCTVTVDGVLMSGWLGAAEINIPKGTSQHTVIVTNGGKQTKYILTTYSHSGSQKKNTEDAVYTITQTPSENGTITVSQSAASPNTAITVTATPDAGYCVKEITVADNSGNQIALTNGNTFIMPEGNVIVGAVFEKSAGSFVDVPASAYYFNAVLWALEKSITTGMDDTHFEPYVGCTRAQTVTFLYRTFGSPSSGKKTAFMDVPVDAWYSDAVAWAAENGITTGTDEGLFDPEATVTRGQIVTFLYRAAGKPAVSGETTFTDVPAGQYYVTAVAWAAENGITTGTGEGLFEPDSVVTRAQAVTFLYRYNEQMKKETEGTL